MTRLSKNGYLTAIEGVRVALEMNLRGIYKKVVPARERSVQKAEIFEMQSCFL